MNKPLIEEPFSEQAKLFKVITDRVLELEDNVSKLTRYTVKLTKVTIKSTQQTNDRILELETQMERLVGVLIKNKEADNGA